MLSGLFNSDDAVIGEAVGMILSPFPGVNAAQFYVNAVDTTTNGLDVVVDYVYRTASAGSIGATASANFTRTEVDAVNVPESVQDNFDVTGPTARTAPTRSGTSSSAVTARTGSRTCCRGSRARSRSATTTAASRPGCAPTSSAAPAFAAPSPTPRGTSLDESFGSEVTLDADIGVRIGGGLRLSVGGNNILNNFPDEQQREDNRYFGTFLYSPTTPYGIEGGFYYLKLQYQM